MLWSDVYRDWSWMLIPDKTEIIGFLSILIGINYILFNIANTTVK